MPVSTFVVLTAGSKINIYACTSNTSDDKQYLDQPTEGTFNHYQSYDGNVDQVIYYQTDANGKRYIVGSEPKSIRH